MRRRQRAIRPDQWTHPGLLRASKEARLTGMGLWGIADDEGRLEIRPDLIAGALYPGDPTMTSDVIETHLLELDEAGFVTLYQSGGRGWMELSSPLVTQRPRPSTAPPPPDMEHSGTFVAVGGAREREEREREERASAWAAWEAEQERGRVPARPLLMDAPPIGCPEHPNGRFADCGPCGTARRRHDRWLAERRYSEQVERYEAAADDDEPF
ncbi:hypothetical protein IT882_13000 [Microbacterium schleiferi]|uniref:Uncharacterized protein n=1 Tax=Microbacterium schleiferi TaxID=69362 RepID=A0A7S8MXB7_9MICO|nr:hypothetical protein [Microbacterium schleiferi]QPE04110.1 hypothetical protein IT882_13000 [Microbacterium schleiferi]